MTKTSTVVIQFPYTAIKMRCDTSIHPDYNGHKEFDMWEWNVWKMKWVRLSRTACGYSALFDVHGLANERSLEIADMIARNQKIPEPL